MGHVRRNNGTVWQVILCLTLLSFLFRAAFPIGYMPNLAGQHDQRLTITLCTMDGTSSVWLDDLSSHAPQSSGHDGTSQICPFSAVVSQAVASGSATLAAVSAIIPQIVARLPRDETPPPTAVIGPPLGSRAPPISLG